MVDDHRDPNTFNISGDLERAVADLEESLAQAAQAAGRIRGQISQIDALAGIIREMEAAMDLARTLAGQPAARPAPGSRANIVDDAFAREPEDIAPAREAEFEAPQPDPVNIVPAREPQFESPQAERARPQSSHRLRLSVISHSGALDLKAVDSSVNENPAVVDVALLDYDGRRATLKLWINGAFDAITVRDALIESLRRRLGDEGDADVRIDFEERNAA